MIKFQILLLCKWYTDNQMNKSVRITADTNNNQVTECEEKTVIFTNNPTQNSAQK